LSLAAWGRKEIKLAEAEMPGLMALREEYGAKKPLKMRALRMPSHDHSNGGLIETLIALGAEVSWSSCKYFLRKITRRQPSLLQEYRLCWKGMNEKEFDWCIEQTLHASKTARH